MKDTPVDLSDHAQKVKLINIIRAKQGVHRVTLIKHHPRRSDRQNRYYWPCFVIPFANFLREQEYEYSDQTAHELLKAKFLRRGVPNPITGEVMEFIPSTSGLDTAEFNDYLDRCAAWLADMFGIVVPDPAQYHETDPTPVPRKGRKGQP